MCVCDNPSQELPNPEQLRHFVSRVKQQQAAPLHTDLVDLLHTIRYALV